MSYIARYVILAILMIPVSANSNSLPTTEEVQGIINVCAAGRSVEIVGELQLSFDKLFSGDFQGNGKITDLGGIIASIKDDKLKVEVFKIYSSCITPLLNSHLSTESRSPASIESEGGKSASSSLEQTSHGEKSPNINSINGDVTINY